MKIKTLHMIMFLCLLFLSSCLTKNMNMPAPVSFQDVSKVMRTPGFWISRIDDPDKIILQSEEIQSFNLQQTERETT